MGTVHELDIELTPELQSLNWVNRYREHRGVSPLDQMPATLTEAVNGEFKVYRSQEEPICWVDLNDVDVGKAVYAAGAGMVKPYLRDPQNPESKRWDVNLPGYLWEWAK